MKKNLEILKWEPKRGKNGEYVRFETNEGWKSCFDSVVTDNLKQFEGSIACVETVDIPGKNFRGEDIIFKNITKCYGEAEKSNVIENYGEDEKPEVVKIGERNIDISDPKGREVKTNEIQVGVYTSYAKDIFCAMLEKGNKADMDDAIELVKQAKEAFE